MSLVFYEKSHRYKLDGHWVPGVTTLISKGLPKVLHYWSARTVAEYVADNEDQVAQLRAMGRAPMVAALKEVPWQKRDEAAIRGTDIHDLAEKIVHGQEVDVPEHLTDYVSGYVDWLDRSGFQPTLTERPCASRRWQFAGKFDAIGTLDGKVALLDWKTASGVYGDNAIQVAAYGHADFYVDDYGNERAMPTVESYGVVHIKPGETTLHEVTDGEAAWKDFLHIQWTAKAADRIKSYLREVVPTDAPETGEAA